MLSRTAAAPLCSRVARPWASSIIFSSFSRQQFSTSAVRLADPNPKKTTKLKDAEKFNTPFPTRFNPRSSANTARPVLPSGLTFNPPPSAPSPFDTPDIFLPLHERRKIETAPSMEVLPPPLRAVVPKKYHLSEKQIDEIRRLRDEDPNRWTRKVLAEKYGCSDFFIALVSRAPKERLDEMDRRLDVIKSRWGMYKRNARLQRQKKREIWARDE
ncbi:mitochondrial 54S ribosomal protein mL58 [Kockiozyma suomiensis]|uniref:mitochondrial 54S ribosomal protein mL58 n=1 Tax=Kockiozyma suomiensis TaxID=1337062 RepID=UPI003343817A